VSDTGTSKDSREATHIAVRELVEAVRHTRRRVRVNGSMAEVARRAAGKRRENKEKGSLRTPGCGEERRVKSARAHQTRSLTAQLQGTAEVTVWYALPLKQLLLVPGERRGSG
jgi:hypothetical protein